MLEAFNVTLPGEHSVPFVTVTVAAGAIVALTATRGAVHAGDDDENST